MRRLGLLALLAGTVVIGVGASVWWRPFLMSDRDYPATIPQTVPLFDTPLVTLDGGQTACFEPAVMDRHSEQARFRVGTFGRPTGVPLDLSVTGPGYRFATRVAGGYGDNALLQVPVQAPRRDLSTQICLRNAGARTVALYAADDRTRAPLTVTRDGRRVRPAVQFAFYEAHPTSIAHRLPATLARMGTFRPGVLGPWLFWPLLFACAIGLPLAALWTVWHAVERSPDQ